MRVGQEHYSDTSGNASVLADNLVFMFRRMSEGQMNERLNAILRAYARPQLRAIAHFVEEMGEQHYQGLGELDDAEHALRLLWAKYL